MKKGKKKEGRGMRIFKNLLPIIICAVFVFGAWYFFGDATAEFYNEVESFGDESRGEACNVLAVPVSGYLATYSFVNADGSDMGFDISSSEYIVDAIRYANETPEIETVLLTIDSSGGDVTTGEEIANALMEFDKYSVAVIRSIGASAAYWAATGADTIFASRISEVGGIGASASYLDETARNELEGYSYVELASAPHKNAGDPNRSLTEEEEEAILSDLAKIHEIFVDDVAKNRELDREAVAELANGLTYLGIDALEYGLIDKLGDTTAALMYIEELMGEKPEICWY